MESEHPWGRSSNLMPGEVAATLAQVSWVSALGEIAASKPLDKWRKNEDQRWMKIILIFQIEFGRWRL